MSNLAMMMGLGSAAGGVNVADVFSTYLYEGNASTQTITNGIDLAGEGGMVWIKARTLAYNHEITDTVRGTDSNGNALRSNSSTTAQNGDLISFTSSGFDLGFITANGNETGHDYASWTWRKAPKFFDVQTWTGDGVSGRQISHDLGSVPGCIFVKIVNSSGNWIVYHRSTGSTKYLELNTTDQAATDSGAYWASTDPTDTHFTVGNTGIINAAGNTYVAYLFAHNEDLIQCGTYTGNGSTTGPIIDLGWQPQWVMIKNTSSAADWYVLDAERGLNGDAIDDPYLRPNLSNVESSTNILKLTATGFQLNSAGLAGVNANGNNYIYMAIKAE